VAPAVNDTPQGLGQTWVQIPGANHPSASKVERTGRIGSSGF
jgi:hypothetical protein